MEVQCSSFKSYEKGSCMGFADLHFRGLIIKVTVYKSEENGVWLGLPSKRYLTGQGEQRYEKLVMFEEQEAYKEFRSKGLEAIRQFIREQRKESRIESHG